MTLKSSDAQKVKENIQTDVPVGGDVVTPKGRRLSPEMQILLNKSIVSRRLRAPSAEEIRIKNTGMYYRWVAWKVLGGRRYGQMKAMGFENATSGDAEAMCPGVSVAEDAITCGDLILMKLPYELWAGHVKANMQKAIQLQSRNNRGMYLDNPDLGQLTDVRSDETPNRKYVNKEPFNRGGLSSFVPSEAELEGKMGKS